MNTRAIANNGKPTIDEGNEHFIWSYNESTKQENLQIATLYLCDSCGTPSTVNSVWVLVGYQFPIGVGAALKQANEIKEKFGLLTELGANEDGDGFCEKCYK
jgi:hypothetical protein